MNLYDLWRKVATRNYNDNDKRIIQDAINKAYSTSQPSYTPPLSYPTRATKQTGYKDINVPPQIHHISRANLGAYRFMVPQDEWESDDEYYRRLQGIYDKGLIPGRVQKLDRQRVVYNPDPARPFFPHKPLNPNERSYVSLDIETDDYGHPISISALRFQYNKQANRFESVDNYQRFYKTHPWDIRNTQAIHGFTPSKLRSLRGQQGAKYGKTYKGQEIEDLKQFLGNSVIVGHNIQQFDLNKLFPDETIQNTTIDTLAAARSAWRGKKNDLDHVFYRVFGKTMEQAGLYHHDANADTIASMMILQEMSKNQGIVGKSIRHVMASPSQLQLVEYDEYLKSMIARGDYKKIYSLHDLSEVYMDAKELGLQNGEGKWIGGMDYDDMGFINSDNLSDDVLMKTAMAEAIRNAKENVAEKFSNPVRKQASLPLLSNMPSELQQAFNQFNNYKQLSLIKDLARATSEEEVIALGKAAGYNTQVAGGIFEGLRSRASDLHAIWEKKKAAEAAQRAEEESFRKSRMLDKEVRRGHISAEQRASLESLEGSYSDLVDATEEVIEANRNLEKSYRSIASIKPYDINNFVGAARGQWEGIMGAARGVVPSFIRTPIGRLGAAAFNYVDKQLAPWNAVQRFYNSTLSNVFGGFGGGGLSGGGSGGGAVGLGSKLGAGMGMFNMGTQAVGNFAQAKVEMLGLGIQNNLNTLGAMVSWISTPFQLLHKAAKLLIGSFTGLSFSIKNFMTSGIGLMSQMGNPLTSLTGVNYPSYAGSTMMDIASLFGKGSMNSVYENFAYQQQGMMLGNFNTDRMIAASMLGVYDDVYGRGGNSQAKYNAMANRLLSSLSTQSEDQKAWTMYLASQIDSNLPSLLQSAQVLGVTDIGDLTDPARRGMHWRPLSDTEATAFRWTQYEYGAAKEQMGYSKMRVANSLWNMGGKSIYNAFNQLADGIAQAISTGKWDSVVKQATAIWDKAREAFSNAWEGIKSALGGEGEEGNSIVNTFKGIGLLIENVALKTALKIVNIWDDIMGMLLQKSQGLIAYLSTIQLKPTFNDGKLGFEITSISDVKANDSDRIFNTYRSQGDTVVRGTRSGMSKIGALYDMLFPGAYAWDKEKATVGDIRAKIAQLHEAGLPVMGLSELGIEQIGTDEASVDALLNYLLRSESDRGLLTEQAAAWAMPMNYNTVFDKQAIYDKSGLSDAYNNITGSMEGILGNVISSKIADNYARVDLYFKDGTGKKAMIAADSEGNVMSKDLVLLSQMLPKGLELVVNQIK